jgi:glyceraldehyde 3-phosphate dehydrogenase
MKKIAINGYGRIGRCVTRAFYEREKSADFKIVAINDAAPSDSMVHLTKYDTTHGRFHADVKFANNNSVVMINGDAIELSHVKDPRQLPWRAQEIDLVLECSGQFTARAKAQAHLDCGAKRVLIGAPAGHDVDLTVVYGINHHELKKEHHIISNASCTTNCMAPVVKALCDTVGIEQGLMTTIHAYTNNQSLLDTHFTDLRRARAATQSMIPTGTGATKALGVVVPEVAGKITGYSMRVPTLNVSCVDLTFNTKRATTASEINAIMKDASENRFDGILAFNEEELVSIDFNHHPASAIFDATQTIVMGNLVKVLAWYDNEWGYANRLLDLAQVIAKL